MAKPGDEMAAATAGHGRFRASHADREHVIDVLKAAFVQGRLTKDEFDLRVGQTFASRTYAELAVVTADIPAGLIGARPLGKPARAQDRPPMNTVVKAGICVGIAAAVLVASFFTEGSTVLLVAGFYFMALLVAGAQILDSRHEKRSRGQLPPGPAQRGRALEGEQGGTIGNDLILSEVRRDARAPHVPDHRVIQRTWRSLTVRRDERRPANLRATA